MWLELLLVTWCISSTGDTTTNSNCNLNNVTRAIMSMIVSLSFWVMDVSFLYLMMLESFNCRG